MNKNYEVEKVLRIEKSRWELQDFLLNIPKNGEFFIIRQIDYTTNLKRKEK